MWYTSRICSCLALIAICMSGLAEAGYKWPKYCSPPVYYHKPTCSPPPYCYPVATHAPPPKCYYSPPPVTIYSPPPKCYSPPVYYHKPTCSPPPYCYPVATKAPPPYCAPVYKPPKKGVKCGKVRCAYLTEICCKAKVISYWGWHKYITYAPLCYPAGTKCIKC